MYVDKKEAMQEYFNWCLKNLIKERNKDDLHAFIQLYFGYNVPRNRVCSDHNAPFDFIADTFFEEVLECIVMANRNGGKTQNFGIKNALDGLFKGCEIATIGAIQAQAEKCYSYTQKILTREYIKPYLIDALMKKTIVRTFDGHLSEIQILPGTMAGVNSPHPQKANLDEVELMKWNILQEAMSMPKSNNRAKAGLAITSTRKFSYGPMQKLLNEATERKLKIYQWCIWEVIEPCPDSRSGTKRRKHTFVPNGGKQPITIDVFDGCLKCPLIDVCQTKAKRSDGYYTIEDTISKFNQLDRETWDAQWECKKPGRTGLVYGDFSGLSVPIGNIIDRYDFNPNLPTFGGQDWGFTNPSHAIFAQVTPSEDIIIFDELVKVKMASPDYILNHLAPMCKSYSNQGHYYDPAAADEGAQMINAGIKAIVGNNDIDSGITSVRAYVKTPQGNRKLYVLAKCKNTIEDLNTYHYREGTDKPEKDIGDHGCDAIRYFIHTKYPFVKKNKKVRAKSV